MIDATFHTSSLDLVVLFPEAFMSMPRLEPVSYKVRYIATPMLNQSYCGGFISSKYILEMKIYWHFIINVNGIY